MVNGKSGSSENAGKQAKLNGFSPTAARIKYDWHKYVRKTSAKRAYYIEDTQYVIDLNCGIRHLWHSDCSSLPTHSPDLQCYQSTHQCYILERDACTTWVWAPICYVLCCWLIWDLQDLRYSAELYTKGQKFCTVKSKNSYKIKQWMDFIQILPKMFLCVYNTPTKFHTLDIENFIKNRHNITRSGIFRF